MCEKCSQLAAQPSLDQGQAISLLEQFHQFPCLYTFKIIGFARPDLADQVRHAAHQALGDLPEETSVSCRDSSGGRYTSVTLETSLTSANAVLEVYEHLRQIQGLVSVF